MLSSPTVFVIGAGASYEVGLPVGEELKDQIASLLNIKFPNGWEQESGDHQIAEVLKGLAHARGQRDWNYLLHKCWLVRNALPGSLSIDNLLDAHRDDADISLIGKIAISKAILKAERKSRLYREPNPGRPLKFSDVAGTWLLPLFQLLSEGLVKEHADTIFKNVTFIVFNYDRSLELFLPFALQEYYGLSRVESEQIAATANIIHPYGQVGLLGSSDNQQGVPYGSDRYDLIDVASSIKTFSEGLLYESHKETMNAAIMESEQVIFLGFAFHPLNMDLISVDTGSKVQRIWGTTLGMSSAAVRAVERGIFGSLKKRLSKVKSVLPDVLELTELSLEPKTANVFLTEHFRGIT